MDNRNSFRKTRITKNGYVQTITQLQLQELKPYPKT